MRAINDKHRIMKISPCLLPELNGKGVLSVSELEITKNWNDSLKSNLSLRGYLFR